MDRVSEQGATGKPCRILSLDGGGAKGFYTLGVLREVEALAGRKLSGVFDLIYGTSTGSIIAALLGLGLTVSEIHELYCKHVVEIMQAKRRADKSAALGRLAEDVFGERTFEDFTTGIGIVTAKWQAETPMIFKSRHAQGHGRLATFTPGFGCRIADAVQASCSAYPFFERQVVKTAAGDEVELVDGGYCANNPTLYAIADAKVALGFAEDDLRVLSVGVGSYPAPKPSIGAWMLQRLLSVQLLQKTLEINTASMEQLRSILFKSVPTVRVNDAFTHPTMATDMFEHDLRKLNLLRQKGADSFASQEGEIKALLEA